MSKSFENNRLLLRNIISIIWRFNAIIPKLVIYKVAKSNFEYILIKKNKKSIIILIKTAHL